MNKVRSYYPHWLETYGARLIARPAWFAQGLPARTVLRRWTVGVFAGRGRGSRPGCLAGRAEGVLPVPYRLAILYLMLPVAIWLLGWFRWWVGWPLTLLIGACLRPVLAGPWRGRPRRETWALLAAALVWVWLAAVGGLFDHRLGDWQKHHALLQDLGRYPWPAFLPDPLAAALGIEDLPAGPLLRYHLGWYLAPGLAARLWGLEALSWAVPVWIWAGTALVLCLFVGHRRGRYALAAAAILIFFGDLDILRVWRYPGHYIPLPWPVDVGMPSPLMNKWIWSPQHFFPIGLYVLLLWRLRRHPRFLAVSGILLAAAPFWTVFGAIGLLPLAAALVRLNGLRPFLRWPHLVAAGWLAGLVILYLTTETGAFPRRWLWERHDWPLLARWLPVIYLSEFLLLTFLLLRARPVLGRQPFFAASLAAHSLLPLYFFGTYDDLAVRGAIPALMWLACGCADSLARPARAWRPHRRWARAGLIGVLAVGAAAPVHVFLYAVQVIRPFRDVPTTLTALVDMSRTWEIPQYVAFARPPALDALLRTPGRVSAPEAGEPLVRGDGLVDVHWDGRSVMYVTDASAACRWSALQPALFLQVQPANWSDFEPAQLFYRLDRLGAEAQGYARQAGAVCGWRWILPSLDFAAASLRTGQSGRWEAELFLEAAGNVARVEYRDAPALRATYRALAAEPPTASGAFNAHLVPNGLALARDGCRAADLAAPFFLHVVPFEIAALPPLRQAHGFAVRNFPFETVGSRVDDLCWATLPLPAYGIRTLRLGQFTDAGPVWRMEIPFADHVPAAWADLRAAYRATASRIPAVRAVFDVYVSDREVTFVKTPCRPEDVAAKFVLHAVPVNPRSLPTDRRRAGFANLDFPLEGYGALFDGVCLARRALPAYAVETLRVGQFLSRDNRVLWEAEIAVNPALSRARAAPPSG